MELDFGDYVRIEHKRYGCKNEFVYYKVIQQFRSNTYRAVPVDARQLKLVKSDKLQDTVRVIRCGVCEDKVESFRVQDVQLVVKI